MMITETSQCSKRPMKGALRGLLLAQRRENGRMPSRPISCTTSCVVSIYIREKFSGGVGHTSTLRKDNAQYISKSRKCNEDGEDSFGADSEHITEKSGSYNLFGADDVCFWDGSKVRDL
jgi:hypothetical protein